MPKNFYNLPPPWNPGYAIPESVMSEGLQRHAYVTKWLPRGTFDNSTDGSAGYAIPQYVLEEGTGRGTFTTAWAPRGTAPKVDNFLNRHPFRDPAVKVGMGDSAAPTQKSAALARYGQRTARTIVRSLAKVAPAQRDAMLRDIAKRIDPSLYGRIQAEIARARMQGLPPERAFEAGVASAMTTGLLNELSDLGKTRKQPKRNSLLGVGMYEALGVTLTNIAALPTISQVSAPSPTRVDPAVTAPTGGKQVQVGPFTFPVGDKAFLLVDGATQYKTIPASWMRAVRRALVISKADIDALVQSAQAGTAGAATVANMKLQKAPTNKVWQDVLGIRPTETVTMRAISPRMTSDKWSDSDDGRAMPIATFTHPASGNKWGVFLHLLGGNTNPYSVQLYVKWLPQRPWYARALSWIADFPAKLVDFVKEVAEAIGSAACDFLQTPGAAAGAAAATGGAAGAGVVVAAGLCGPGQAPPPPPPDTGPSLVTIAAIGGGALLAIHFLTKKKATP